jgi:hypothetical protein
MPWSQVAPQENICCKKVNLMSLNEEEMLQNSPACSCSVAETLLVSHDDAALQPRNIVA